MLFGLIKTFEQKLEKVKKVVDSGKSRVVKYPVTNNNLAYMLEALDRYRDDAVAVHFCQLYMGQKATEIIETR